MTRIKVSSAKAKGRNLQKWVADKISQLLNIPWGSEDDKLIQSRPMGQSGTDVILRKEALEKFPYSIECKSTETWALPKTIKQVKNNLKSGTDWLIFLKKKEFKKPIVVMEAEHFFFLKTAAKIAYKELELLTDDIITPELLERKEESFNVDDFVKRIMRKDIRFKDMSLEELKEECLLCGTQRCYPEYCELNDELIKRDKECQ